MTVSELGVAFLVFAVVILLCTVYLLLQIDGWGKWICRAIDRNREFCTREDVLNEHLRCPDCEWHEECKGGEK